MITMFAAVFVLCVVSLSLCFMFKPSTHRQEEEVLAPATVETTETPADLKLEAQA